MEGFGGSGFNSVGNSVRKKRSNTSRRPRPDSQPFPDNRDLSSLSPTPLSDNVGKVSSDENTGYDPSFRRKEFNLNQCVLKVSSVNRAEGETVHKKIGNDEGALREFDKFYGNGDSRGMNEQGRSGSDVKRCSKGVLAPANWKSISKVKESFELQPRNMDSHISSVRSGENWNLGLSGVVSDGLGNENKLKKVKLKVGGVTRTIHAKSTSDGAFGGVASSMKFSTSSDLPRPRQKLSLQENSDDGHSRPQDMPGSLQGVPWKDFSRGGFSIGKEYPSRDRMSEEIVTGKQTDKYEPVRKSKRVPKRRVLDGAFEDGVEDDEIRYLEKLKMSKVTADSDVAYENNEVGSSKQRRISRVSKSREVDVNYDEDVEEYGSLKSGKDGKKKFRSEKLSEDTDYAEEEEPVSDGEPEAEKKKPRMEPIDSLMEGKKEMTLTTRQRALQSGKDVSSGTGASLVEFPNGLPPAPPRKQKEKLSEVEQQLKKAEAAQRRRMQVEKAAKESEAEAIRKILGQDSSRKKREDKIKKRRDELAQERAANATTIPPNTIRWVMGPTGTTVTFPEGLPSIFDSKPCSYPPPREKCVGPSCTNPYRYRCSKTKLPLCSLQCYKAIHEKMQQETSS